MVTKTKTKPKAKKKKKIVNNDLYGVYHPQGMSLPTSKTWAGWKKRICVAVPSTGLCRIEWMMARGGQVIPCNWSNGDIFQFFNQFSPLGWSVADARNFCVKHSLSQGFEWTFFLDHDVILKPDTFLKLNEYMESGEYPVVSGLYYCKGSHPEPLMFRGRGTGVFRKWKRGDKVMVDGIPMGCTLVHNSILQTMYNESEEYTYPTLAGNAIVRRVFETPRHAWCDPETGGYVMKVGTEDLYWCDRIRSTKVFERCGVKKYAKFQKEKYPYLLDTSMFCQHIDEQGVQYPANIGIV